MIVDQSQLPSPPITRLLGIRAGHVGPGSGTWVMPATGWSSIATGELEVSMLAETAVTGVAMTTLTPGLDVEPVSLALNYFRPPRPQAGNLLPRARVVNASRLFVFVEIEIEDPNGRKVAHGTSHCEVRRVEPSPPPPPSELRRVAARRPEQARVALPVLSLRGARRHRIAGQLRLADLRLAARAARPVVSRPCSLDVLLPGRSRDSPALVTSWCPAR